MQNPKYVRIAAIIVIIIIVIALFSKRIFYVIEPGERAVVFKTFLGGLDNDNVKGQGFHIVAPWNKLIVYEVKDQVSEESMNILDKNGLEMTIDVTIRFNPVYDKIGYIYEKFKLDYKELLIIPEVRSTVRKVMGRYKAEEIYSTKRSEVEATITLETEKVLAENNVQMKTLLIRSIKLPSKIKDAIDAKEEQKQIAEAYKYKLQKEKSEAERKLIAAKADSSVNAILNSSLTDKLLKLKGIEVTQEIATSTNAKTVIIGGKDGLPIILNDK